MSRRLALASLLLLILPAAVAAEGAGRRAPAKTYRAERFDVRATLEPDRSLRVEETVRFRFDDGTFTSAWREVPTRRTDGIVEIVARMDGAIVPEGSGPGHVQIGRGRRVRVTWHFEPAIGVHEFGLAYRMLGVAAAEGAVDRIAWIALPDDHGYEIDRATVALELPPNARLEGGVRVDQASADVTMAPGRVVVSASKIRRDATLRIEAGIVAGALGAAPPRWQADEVLRRQRGPWLLVVAVTILAAGVAWLLAFLSAFSRPEHDRLAAVPGPFPPEPLRPAAVASRLAGGSTRFRQVAATIVELADRGVLRIDERPRAKLFGRSFDVRLVHEPAGLAPHETALLDVLFGTSTPRAGDVSWSRMQERVNKRGAPFGRALVETMRRAGLVEMDRVAARKTLVRAALFAAAAAAVSAIVAAVSFPAFGAWTIVVPVSAAVVAIVFAVAAGRFSILSRQGEREGRAWRAFFEGLAGKGHEGATDRESVTGSLPWIVASGAGKRVVKRAAAAGVPLPPWFHAAGDDGHEALVALIIAASPTHADAASVGSAAAGGGAAGGGSSGAA